MGVVYFEVTNPGAADSLVGIESAAAVRAEMHSTTTTAKGAMQMRDTPVVAVPAGGHLVFEPGGLHVMLIDLRRPLREAQHVPLTLVFEHAGRLQVDAVVRGPGAGISAHDTDGTAYRLAVWPRPAESPDFELVDVGGRRRTAADYRGRLMVVFFGFVHCPDACPAELFKLGLVMKRLGPLSERVQVLFVTLDPDRDTRRLLQGYVTAFDPRFVGLTGSAAQIDRAAGNFFVEYAKVSTGDGYTIDHSTSTFVLDALGHLRLVGVTSTSVDDYAHDLAALAAE